MLFRLISDAADGYLDLLRRSMLLLFDAPTASNIGVALVLEKSDAAGGDLNFWGNSGSVFSRRFTVESDASPKRRRKRRHEIITKAIAIPPSVGLK